MRHVLSRQQDKLHWQLRLKQKNKVLMLFQVFTSYFTSFAWKSYGICCTVWIRSCDIPGEVLKD
jgi:hypothetical protein